MTREEWLKWFYSLTEEEQRPFVQACIKGMEKVIVDEAIEASAYWDEIHK